MNGLIREVLLPLRVEKKGKQLKKEEIENFSITNKPITPAKTHFLPWIGKAG